MVSVEFEFATAARVVFGAGSLAQLGSSMLQAPSSAMGAPPSEATTPVTVAS